MECEYHAAKSNPFIFRIKVDFTEHCEQRHQSIMMVVWRGRHVCIPQQHKQQWPTSLLSVSLSTKCCLTNNSQIIKTTFLKTTCGRVSQISLALQMVSNITLSSLLLDAVP